MRTVLLAALAAIGLAFTALPAHAAAAQTCGGMGTTAGYKIVRLSVSGVSCTKARSIARSVAGDLHRNGSIDVPGVAGFSMSTETCTGCATTTQISLSFPTGAQLTISLRRAGGTSAPSSPTPTPTTGSGGKTIV
jgi:hypothetical protein